MIQIVILPPATGSMKFDQGAMLGELVLVLRYTVISDEDKFIHWDHEPSLIATGCTYLHLLWLI